MKRKVTQIKELKNFKLKIVPLAQPMLRIMLYVVVVLAAAAVIIIEIMCYANRIPFATTTRI